MHPRVYLDQLLIRRDPFIPRVRVSDNMVNTKLTLKLKNILCHSYRISPSNQASHTIFLRSPLALSLSLYLSLSEHKNCIIYFTQIFLIALLYLKTQ